MEKLRLDGRGFNELRPVQIHRGFMPYAEGSCLIEMGNTRVICTATVQEGVPPFLIDEGRGWLTAEYSMLPRATQTRNKRPVGKLDGRSQEIQRLVGRSLRAGVDLTKLGEHTILIDCDVLQADGGTRTASITGAFVAVADALTYMQKNGLLNGSDLPLLGQVAAVSVGLVDGKPSLDLCYQEDSKAGVDMNVVMLGQDKLIEIQGTAEHGSYGRAEMNTMLDLAEQGIRELQEKQKVALGW